MLSHPLSSWSAAHAQRMRPPPRGGNSWMRWRPSCPKLWTSLPARATSPRWIWPKPPLGRECRYISRYSRVETIGGEPVPVREALAAINRVIAEYDERQQGDLDPQTRFLPRLVHPERL